MKLKLYIYIIGLVVITYLLPSCWGYSSKISSKPQNFYVKRNVVPPILNIDAIQFVDENGNNVINANEKCYISLKIRNSGQGDAVGLNGEFRGNGTIRGIKIYEPKIPTIAKGQSAEVHFPIHSDINTENGEIQFFVKIIEPNGFDTKGDTIRVHTREFEAPQVRIVSYKIICDNKSGKLQKNSTFQLQIMLQNTGVGIAEQVNMTFTQPENVTIMDGQEKIYIENLKPGEKQTFTYSLAAPNKVANRVTANIQLKEKYGKYAENSVIPIIFGENVNTGIVEIKPKEQEHQKIVVGSLISDVDQNIPMSKTKAYNTYALIIANENYTSAPNVSYAINDGKSFRDYCIKTLGVPEDNIQYVTDATLNGLKLEINKLQNFIRTLDGQAKVIVYYAGHGIPDDVNGNGNAYLLPTDGMASNPTTAYKLDNLYDALGEYETQGITIFIDACFSGGTRDLSKTIYGDARGVAVRVKRGQPVGNMVVFSAAQENQTANPYPEQQHGMFTYFLLKKIKETEGNISLNDLAETVIKDVKIQSNHENTYQEPCIIASPTADANWRNWKLK